MHAREQPQEAVSRALSTAIVSSAGAFAALTLLSIGLHGTGVGGPVIAELWPGLAAIAGVALAVFLMGVQVFSDALRMPGQMRSALVRAHRSGDESAGYSERWDRARYRSLVIGGFGTPLGALVIGAGVVGGREHLLWAGCVIAALSLLQLVLAIWIASRIRRWGADLAAAIGDSDRQGSRRVDYQPFEQLRILLTAAPARIVTVFLVLGFLGLLSLVVFNLAVLGHQAGYSSIALQTGASVPDSDAQVVETIVFVTAVAFGIALLVALIDIVRGMFDAGEAHPLERLAHPLAGIAPACIAIGFAFVLVIPGEIPLGATSDHVDEMQQLIWLGVAGVAMLLLAEVCAGAGARLRERALD